MAGETRHKTPSLRLYRRLANKSQREVAREAGISAAFVSQLETGRKDARCSTVDALAHAVYVELPDLLEEPPEGSHPSGDAARPCAGNLPGHSPDVLPEVGERAVVTLSGVSGIVEERWKSDVTALTYFRIQPDNLSFDLVQSSLTVKKEES